MADENKLAEVEAKLADALASIEKLDAKNKELLAEKRSTKTGAEAKVADLEAKVDELSETLAKSQRDHEKALKLAEKARDDALAAAQAETGAVSKLVLENGLTDTLLKAGYEKEKVPAIRAYLKEQGVLSVKSEGDVRRAVAMVDGKDMALDEYVTKTFATSDVGKAWLPGGGNVGGGAGGSGGGGNAPTDLASRYAEAEKKGDVNAMLNLKRQMQLTGAGA